MKNILVANSFRSLDPKMEQVLEKLFFGGWSLYFWSGRSLENNRLIEKIGGSRRNFFFGPELGRPLNDLVFILLLPFLRLIFIFRFFLHNRERPVKTVIAFGLREKIILAPLVRWFKINIFFIELPENNPLKLKKSFLKLYVKAAREAKIVCFSGLSRTNLLRTGLGEESVEIVKTGVKIAASDQVNLFQTLARENNSFHRKFFTIGTVVDLNKKQKVEILFQAIKECREAVPNLQLVIIGEGKEKKNLSWIAKKLKIDNQVWFISSSPPGNSRPSGPVGDATCPVCIPKKWLDSFELYISVCEQPRLQDFSYVLEAMANNIPVVAPAGLGFEDLIVQNKTGSLIEMDLSEMLARQLIKLYQNLNLRLQLGENARALVDREFTLDKMVEDFQKLITQTL